MTVTADIITENLYQCKLAKPKIITSSFVTYDSLRLVYSVIAAAALPVETSRTSHTMDASPVRGYAAGESYSMLTGAFL